MRSGAAKPAAPRQAVPHPADRLEPGGARPGAGRGAGGPGRCRRAGPEHARPRRDAASRPAAAPAGPGAPPPPQPPPAPPPPPPPPPPASPSPEPSPTPPPTVVPGVRYVVQPGDTLSAIARRFGTTVAAIASANTLADPDEIVVGRVLFIPTTGPPPSPTPATTAQVIRRGDASHRVVALSFDAAADAGFTA